MTFATLLLIAIGLSMDAFGASVSRGASMSAQARFGAMAGSSLVFGLFATLAPLFGWAIGKAFYAVIEAYDHWVALALLFVVGAKMVRDGLAHPEPRPIEAGYRLVVLVTAAIATSIDAAAVGLTLPAFRVNLFLAAPLIGAVTFAAALAGAVTGRYMGGVAGKRAEIAGGALLIVIGAKIAIEHMMLGPQFG